MGLSIRLFKHKKKELNGKWYGKATSTGEVHTEELARNICHDTTLTEADVHASIIALVEEMKRQLQDGRTVVLDGFGRFHLTIKSDMVEKPEDFNLSKHVKRILCKFTQPPDATSSTAIWSAPSPMESTCTWLRNTSLQRWIRQPRYKKND